MLENDKVKLTAVVIGTTIFFAYFNQFIYYNYFHVDISNYLDIQDVLTPFLDELTMIIMLGAIGAVGVYTDLLKTKEPPILTVEQINKGIAFCWISIVVLVGIMFYLIYIDVIYMFWLTIIPLVILLSMLILLFENYEIIQKLRDENETEYKNINLIINYVFVVIMCSSIILFKLGIEIFYTKEDYWLYNTYKFKMKDDEEIITSEKVIYLGRTKNHFFIYKEVDREAFPNKYPFEVDSTHCQIDVYNTSEIIKEEHLLKKPL